MIIWKEKKTRNDYELTRSEFRMKWRAWDAGNGPRAVLEWSKPRRNLAFNYTTADWSDLKKDLSVQIQANMKRVGFRSVYIQ